MICSLIKKLRYWLTQTANGPIKAESQKLNGLFDIWATYIEQNNTEYNIIAETQTLLTIKRFVIFENAIP